MKKMLSFALITAPILLLCSLTNTYALTLSERGVGQVLEFPYYTANANQGTVVTVVNTTEHVKALKVRFHEAYDGRTVESLNVYLSPFDVWTAEVVPNGDSTALISADRSCTAPKFESAAGPPSMAFSPANFTGANTDGGPTAASRTREGHFEIFEMGEITSNAHGFIDAITHQHGVPQDCAKIVAAWNAGGTWADNASTDLSPPDGGLYGAAGVVNVEQGTFFAFEPSAIDGFSSVAQHTAPQDVAPDFNTASAGTDGDVAVSVDVGGQPVTARFGNPADAVSALFMASQVMNEYVATADGAEQTDWVATFPTKRFYVDPELNTSTGQPNPFEFMFGDGDEGSTSCVSVNIVIFDREENAVVPPSCSFECPPSPPGNFCYETSVIPFATTGSALHTELKQNSLADNFLGHGHIQIGLGSETLNHKLTSDDGTIFYGLPIVGFVAENFINKNVVPGVLANYSASIRHRSTLKCGRVMGVQSAACL